MISIRIIAGRESAYWSIRFTRRTDWRQKRWSYWPNMLFSYLKLHQLFVHIPIGNEPSKALFARCGFTVTGILTDWITIKMVIRTS